MYSVFYSDSYGKEHNVQNYIPTASEATEHYKRLRANLATSPMPIDFTHDREVWIEKVGSTLRYFPIVFDLL